MASEPERATDLARLGAYTMSGSLRYAQDLADDGRKPNGRDEVRAAIDRCREDLAARPPRTLPLCAAATDGGSAPAASWIEPYPDDLFPESLGPAARYAPRDVVDLAFVAALQQVPVRERGLVALHDVLGVDGGPEAELEEARAALAAARAGTAEPVQGRPAEGEAALTMRFIFSCESADRDGLRALLTPGSVLQSVPDGAVHRGPDAVATELLRVEGGGGAPGLLRLLPRRANGRLAFGVYRRDGRGEPFRAHALSVLTLDGPHVAGVVRFADPSLFAEFDLLPELAAQGERPSR